MRQACANLQGCACLAHACAWLRLEPLRACAIVREVCLEGVPDLLFYFEVSNVYIWDDIL